ncbi:putative membrane protein YdjX (TVP38/TMEM64 family) [Anoxybacillus voinovskiensis]|uniref:TVP38/TMEM64 family membrane protein n=1 Tax=Anoxybacteroides voinovskiense TaxID=230470 RepID=A0A840E033_9BACL|nr:TVP38/TMEM64 family protein [Anoxybacillus voinovskiensis]MBB4074586.1 putative membrane protein YdjX (TVP38/TMEM64 family) [Anoxybacillus voinovskiensis]GGJ71973.1 TVP38/TMEM64 family protein [Anoxybacillus voinovskiensis]
MDVETLKHWFTLQHVLQLLEHYRSFGMLPGVIVTLLESFFPVLPMFVLVMANAAAFGLWKGIMISWIGACLGSILVFLLARKVGQKRFFRFLNRHQKVRQLVSWVERHGFGPLFLLFCFPFTPSAIINVVAGLSRVSKQQFILAVLLGKMVMIFVISFIGYDLAALAKQPLRTVAVVIIVFLLWYAGKKVEAKFSLTEKMSKEDS